MYPKPFYPKQTTTNLQTTKARKSDCLKHQLNSFAAKPLGDVSTPLVYKLWLQSKNAYL